MEEVKMAFISFPRNIGKVEGLVKGLKTVCIIKVLRLI